MTSENKKKIYELLKVANNNILGFCDKSFENEPNFCDDLENSKNLINNSNEIQNLSQNSQKTENLSENQDFYKNENSQDSSLSILKINEQINSCSLCRLSNSKKHEILSKGVQNPIVLVVGESPTIQDEENKTVFSGNEGDLLDKMLFAINLDKNKNCYLTYATKCKTPNNRNPYPDEIEACKAFLDAQILVLKPKMILCFGRIAIQNLIKTEDSLEKIHGQFFDYNGIPVMSTYSPSILLKDVNLKRPAWEDLKKFKLKLLEIDSDFEK